MAINIENKKQVAILLLAIGLGLVAAFLTSQYVESRIRKQTQALATDYEKQTKAQRSALGKELQLMQNDFHKKINELARQQRAQIQQAQLQGNKPQMKSRKKVVDSSVFSEITPVRKRAITINIDSLSAVGGLINPGDHVDVLAHLRIPDTKTKKVVNVTTVLFQNIQILAIGTNFKPVGNTLVYEQQHKQSMLKITFALTSEEVGLLAFVQSNGKLQLALRSDKEEAIQNLQVASWDTLSDYILEHQGTELLIPEEIRPSVSIQEGGGIREEVKPFIQIFRRGKEL